MHNYPHCLQNLIDHFKKLPGIGPKSAERIAFHILKLEPAAVSSLAHSIIELKKNIKFCSQCFNLSEKELCNICKDPRRNQNIVCIVEKPVDIQAIEKTKKYNGLYHVLLGKISPLDGIGPDQIKIPELLTRIKKHKPAEIIIATSADIEGETTALYLAESIKPMGIKVTRLAYGIPVGSSLEFTDEMTLSRSLEGRRIFT